MGVTTMMTRVDMILLLRNVEIIEVERTILFRIRAVALRTVMVVRVVGIVVVMAAT